MTSNKLGRAALSALCSVSLVVASCGGTERGTDSADELNADVGLQPRSGVIEWQGELEQLRKAPVTFEPSAEVGALPARSWADDSGGAHYSIPLSVAPGPNGYAPSLNLTYSSQSGNGALGLGFSVASTPSISRCRRTLAKDGYYEALTMGVDDAICFGGQRLVLEDGSYGLGGSTYRLESDPSKRFSYKGFLGQPQEGAVWRMDSANGETHTFQSVDGARDHWRLAKRTDGRGNVILYDWSVLPDHEVLLTQISYGGTGSLGSARKVFLDYEGRPDAIEGYERGEFYRRTQRVRRIRMEGPNGGVVTSYELAYGRHPNTDESVLHEITRFDASGAALPSTTFSWADDTDPPIADAGARADLEATGLTIPAWFVQSLRQSRSLVLGDYNGDDSDDLLAYFPDEQQYRVNGAPANLLAAPDRLPVGWQDIDHSQHPDWPEDPSLPYLVDDLHRIQQVPGLMHLNFSTENDTSELLAPLRSFVNESEDRDPWGVGRANVLRVALPTTNWEDGPSSLEFAYVDYETDNPFYSVVPLEYNGDGRDDLFICEGTAYKTSHWRLALSRDVVETGEFGWDFIDTNVGCSTHDEYTVLPHERGTEVLAVIPRFETDASEMDTWPSASFSSAAEYQEDIEPIAEAARGGYRVLEANADLDVWSWADDEILPRDLYQRWTDLNCNNGFVHDAEEAPLLGSGLSRDRAIDVDGDGNRDLIRFELEEGDTAANIEAITSQVESNSDGYSFDVSCSPSSGQRGVLRVYRNTGAGYVPMDTPAWTFPGSPHANLWVNWYGAQLLDWNADGLLDIALPSDAHADNPSNPTVQDEDWAILLSNGDGSFTNLDVDDAPAWPHYAPGADLGTLFDEVADTRTFSVGRLTYENSSFAGWGARTLFLRGSQTTTEWRSEQGIQRPLLETATDGQGLEHAFSYLGMPGGTLLSSRSINVPSSGGTEELGAWRSWDYEYSEPARDRYGMRDIGFDWVRETFLGERSGYQWERSTQLRIYDHSYDANLRAYPRSGQPATVESAWVSDDGQDEEEWHIQCSRAEDWAVDVQTLAGGEIWQAYPSASEAFSVTRAIPGYDRLSPSHDLGPGPDGQCDDFSPTTYQTHSTSEQDRDDYGNVEESRSEVLVGVSEATSSTTTYDDFEYDTYNWIVAAPRLVTTENCTAGGTECLAQEVEVSYYPGSHLVESVTRQPGTPEAQTTSFTYDAHGNIFLATISTPSEGSRSVTTTWDAEGVLPLAETNDLGQETNMVFDNATGLPIAVVDPNGLTLKARYDGFFRPVQSSFHSSPMGPSDGANRENSYEVGSVTGAVLDIETRAQGQETRVSYDRAGRVVRELWHGVEAATDFPVDADLEGPERCRWYEYNRYGQVLRASEATPSCASPPVSPENWQRNVYDNGGRLLATSWSDDGSEVQSSVEHLDFLWAGLASPDVPSPRGHGIVTTDPEGKTTTRVVDSFGRISASVDALGTMTCFDYGSVGELTAVHRNCGVGAKGPVEVSTYGYDNIARLVSSTEPANGTQFRTYTEFDEVDLAIDAKGQVLDHDYDVLGRLVSRNSDDGTDSWKFDDPLVGAPSEQQSADGVRQAFGYDSFGRPQTVRHYMPELQSPDAWKIKSSTAWLFSYDYDAQGRLASIRYPYATPDTAALDPLAFKNGFLATFNYDGSSHLRSVSGANRVLWALGDANPAGYPLREEFNQNHPTTAGQSKFTDYEPFTNRVRAIDVTTGSGPVQEFEYEWTAAGDLHRRTEATTNQDEWFGYDDLHRLTGRNGTATSTYDALGNITSRSGVGDYGYDPLTGRLSWHGTPANDVGYDANGNVKKVDGVEIGWNALDKVRTLSSAAGQTSFAYSAGGARALRYDNERYTMTLGGLFEYSNEPGKKSARKLKARYFVPVGGAVVEVRDERTSGQKKWSRDVLYQYNDHLGSGSVLVDEDGDLEEAVSYGPWGEARQWDNWDLEMSPEGLQELASGFTGHQPELDTGLINMRGRMYSPKLARFLSVDPVIESASDAQTWNAYSYVQNNPLRYTDPTGYSAHPTRPDLPCEISPELCPESDGKTLSSGEDEGRSASLPSNPTPGGSGDGGLFGPGSTGSAAPGGDGGKSGAGGNSTKSNPRGQGGPAALPGLPGCAAGGACHRALTELYSRPACTVSNVGQNGCTAAMAEAGAQERAEARANSCGPMCGPEGNVGEIVAARSSGGKFAIGASAAVSVGLMGAPLVTGGATAVAPVLSNAAAGAGGALKAVGWRVYSAAAAANAWVSSCSLGSAANCGGSQRRFWRITKAGTDRAVSWGGRTISRHKTTKLWWSRDTAGHGGSAWKVFREEKGGLRHFRDADIYGDFITGKHKGPVGEFIPWSQLGGK